MRHHCFFASLFYKYLHLSMIEYYQNIAAITVASMMSKAPCLLSAEFTQLSFNPQYSKCGHHTDNSTSNDDRDPSVHIRSEKELASC